MSDVFDKEKRSWVMSRIKGKNTKMEILFETKLKENNIAFERHPNILGKPDFVIHDDLIVFIDGCFWHKCPKCYKEPKTNKKFWSSKIEKNVKRDRDVTRRLKYEGYKIIRFWEHQIEKNPSGCLKILSKNLGKIE